MKNFIIGLTVVGVCASYVLAIPTFVAVAIWTNDSRWTQTALLMGIFLLLILTVVAFFASLYSSAAKSKAKNDGHDIKL